MCEVAQSAGFNGIVEELDVGKVLLAIERRTAKALTAEDYLVLLQVGLLQHDGNTVGECQLLVVELLAGYFLLDFASLGLFGNERLVLHIVHVSLYLVSTGIGHSLAQRLLRGIDGSILLLIHVKHHHVRVVLGNKLLHQTVHSFKRQVGHEHLLHNLVVVIQ